MTICFARRGFSLAEVLTATIVLSMILLSLLSLVSLMGNVWQDGHKQLYSMNYSKTVMTTVEQDLNRAVKIIYSTVPSIKTWEIYSKLSPDKGYSYEFKEYDKTLERKTIPEGNSTLKLNNIKDFSIKNSGAKTTVFLSSYYYDPTESSETFWDRAVFFTPNLLKH